MFPGVSIWPSTTWRRSKWTPKRFQVDRTGKKRERERERGRKSWYGPKALTYFNSNISTYVYSLFVCTTYMQKQSNNICTNPFQQFMHLPGHHDCQARAKNFAFLQFGEIPKNKFPEEPLNPGSKDKHRPFRCPFSHEIVCFKKFYDPESTFVTNFSKYMRLLTGCVWLQNKQLINSHPCKPYLNDVRWKKTLFSVPAPTYIATPWMLLKAYNENADNYINVLSKKKGKW